MQLSELVSGVFVTEMRCYDAKRPLRLEPELIGMVVDKGYDFPKEIDEQLKEYGQDMWLFREQLDRQTTRAVNSYKGELRGYAARYAD